MVIYEIESLMFLYDINVPDWWGWVILLTLAIPIMLAGFIAMVVMFVSFLAIFVGVGEPAPRDDTVSVRVKDYDMDWDH